MSWKLFIQILILAGTLSLILQSDNGRFVPDHDGFILDTRTGVRYGFDRLPPVPVHPLTRPIGKKGMVERLSEAVSDRVRREPKPLA
jgi:hypothetical protein